MKGLDDLKAKIEELQEKKKWLEIAENSPFQVILKLSELKNKPYGEEVINIILEKKPFFALSFKDLFKRVINSDDFEKKIKKALESDLKVALYSIKKR